MIQESCGWDSHFLPHAPGDTGRECLVVENEQKEADTQREAESRDYLSVPSEMGKQLQILTRQHLLRPQWNLPVLPTTGSWDLGWTEGAKAADSTAGSAERRLVL